MRMIVDSNDLPSKLDARILPQLVCVLLLCVANALAVGPSSDQSRCPDGLTTSSAVWGQDVSVSVPLAYSPDAVQKRSAILVSPQRQGFRGLSSEVLYPQVLLPGSRGPVQSNPRVLLPGSRGPGLNSSTIALRTLGPSRTVYGPAKSNPRLLLPGSRGPGLNSSTIALRTLGPSSAQPRHLVELVPTTSSAVWGQDTVPVPVLVPVPNIPYLPILPLGHNVTCQGQALQPAQGNIYMLVPPRGQLQSYRLVPFLGSCDSLPRHTTNVAPSSLEQGLIPQLVSPGPVQQFFVANSQVLMQNSTLCRNDRSAVLSPPGRESQASSNPGQDPNASAKLSTQDARGLDDLVYKNPSLFPRQPAPVSPVSQQSDRQSVGKIRKGKIRKGQSQKGQSQKGQSQKRQSQKKMKLRPPAVEKYYCLERAYSLPTKDGELPKVHFGPLPLDTFNVPTTRDAGPSSQCVR